MIYVYAFCPPPTNAIAMPAGIVHDMVELVTVGELGAIVERDVDVAQEKDDDVALMNAVLAHDRALGQLFAQMPLLPLRFGTQFTDIEALKAFLAAHGATYGHKLSSLRDKAEYLLKLLPKASELPEIDAAVKGREYFLAKKQRLQTQNDYFEQRGEELQTFIDMLNASAVPLVQSTPQDETARLHILLTRDVGETQALITTWQTHLPSWEISCSDPLPPYHFAG